VIRKPRSVTDASALPLARLVPIPQAKPILFDDTHHLALPRRKAARIEPISSSRRPAASLTVVSSAAAQQSAKPQGLAIFSPFQPAALMQESGFHVRRDKAALIQRVQAPPGDRSSRKQPEQAWRRRNV